MTSGRVACAVFPGVSPAWTFIVGRSFLVAVPHDTTQSVVAALTALVRESSVGIEALLSLLPLAGQGEVESFAVLVRGETDSPTEVMVSVVVRGDIAVDVYSVGGSRRFSAGGIRPWLLSDFQSVIGVVIGAAEAAEPAGADGRWREGGTAIGIGAVPAGTLYWSWPEPGIDDTVLNVPRRAEAEGDTILRVPTADADDTVILRRRHRNQTGSHPPAAAVGEGAGNGIGTSRERRRAPAPPGPPSPSPRYGFRLSGEERQLDSVYYLGRNPRSLRITGGRLPRLLSVASPTAAVSSTHVEIRQEGDAVVVTDLDSTNGTMVSPPGGRTTRLAPGQSLVVVPGTTVDIGDGNIIEILPASVRQAQ